MIEQYDEKTVRIRHNNAWYYISIPAGHNLAAIEKAFLRGFREGATFKE